MSKQLTIRGVSDEVARRLEELSKARRTSVNATVLDLLNRAFDVDERRRRLARYVTWTATDLAELDQAVSGQRLIDQELWGD